jgi:hypothetical protein
MAKGEATNMTKGGGEWMLSSKTDPRWNCVGEAREICGMEIPTECQQRIEELERELGEQPPDLMFTRSRALN